MTPSLYSSLKYTMSYPEILPFLFFFLLPLHSIPLFFPPFIPPKLVVGFKYLLSRYGMPCQDKETLICLMVSLSFISWHLIGVHLPIEKTQAPNTRSSSQLELCALKGSLTRWTLSSRALNIGREVGSGHRLDFLHFLSLG